MSVQTGQMIAITMPLVTTPWAVLSAPVMKDMLEMVKPALVSMKIIVSCIQLRALLLWYILINVYYHTIFICHFGSFKVNETL